MERFYKDIERVKREANIRERQKEEKYNPYDLPIETIMSKSVSQITSDDSFYNKLRAIKIDL